MVGVQTRVEASLIMSPRSACFIDKCFYLAKNTTSSLVNTLKCQIIKISKLSDIRLREFYCNMFKRFYYHYLSTDGEMCHNQQSTVDHFTSCTQPNNCLITVPQFLLLTFYKLRLTVQVLQQSLNFRCSCEDFVAVNDHEL
jgi:hypothetical protein